MNTEKISKIICVIILLIALICALLIQQNRVNKCYEVPAGYKIKEENPYEYTNDRGNLGMIVYFEKDV